MQGTKNESLGAEPVIDNPYPLNPLQTEYTADTYAEHKQIHAEGAYCVTQPEDSSISKPQDAPTNNHILYETPTSDHFLIRAPLVTMPLLKPLQVTMPLISPYW
jgi:hypothetical protein